jgi:hypothetical protein
MKWVEDTGNGLRKEKQIGELIFDIQLRPTDYVLCKSGELDGLISEGLLDSLRRGYDSTLFFSIILKGADGKDPLSVNGNAESALYYFQYQFQQDIYLECDETNSKKVPPVLFHFERFYTLNNSKVFLVAFDKKELIRDKDIKLVIDSKYLSSGLVQFSFDNKQIREQPHIQL